PSMSAMAMLRQLSDPAAAVERMWFTEGYPLTGIRFGSKLGRMKPTLLGLLLVTSLAFAQKPTDIKFQDASARGAPASLCVKYEPDVGLYAAVRNTSARGIWAFFAV